MESASPNLIVFAIIVIFQLVIGAVMVVAGLVLLAKGKKKDVAQNVSIGKRINIGTVSAGALLVLLGTAVVLFGVKGSRFEPDGNIVLEATEAVEEETTDDDSATDDDTP